jgi:hypothetical protein
MPAPRRRGANLTGTSIVQQFKAEEPIVATDLDAFDLAFID